MALGFRASNTLFRNLLRLASTKMVLFPVSRALKWGCVYDSGSSICSDEYLIERRFCTQIQQPLPSEREVQRRPVRISGRKSRHRSGNRAPVVWSHRQHGGFSSAQLLSRVRLFATPWTAACQASLSITSSQNLLKLMSMELVMPSNPLILCCPLLLQATWWLLLYKETTVLSTQEVRAVTLRLVPWHLWVFLPG